MSAATLTRSTQRKLPIGQFLLYFFLILGALTMLVPFIWMFLTSVKSIGESMRVPPTILPAVWNWQNYPDVMKSLPFVNLYTNTIVLIFLRIICAVGFSSMAGYAFAKIHFPGRNLLFGLILAQNMLPGQIFIIPQYTMLANLHSLNNMFALLFPGLVSAFGTFFLRQTYMSLPDDLVEAARLDGCNQWQTFIKIMAPLTKTSIMALGVFTAVFAYSDLMWPLICNTDLKQMTLSAGLSTLRGQFTTKYPTLMAGSVLAMWPMLLLYLIFQRQFIEGIALTGTKA
jgi:multiple sugar transport system permease protein